MIVTSGLSALNTPPQADKMRPKVDNPPSERNLMIYVDAVVHPDFYYRQLRLSYQPLKIFSFYAERADYQNLLFAGYNRNSLGGTWHLATPWERLNFSLSGGFSLANGTRQWVPVTDATLAVKFRIFWRVHFFAQTRNYFYRNAVLDESMAALRLEGLIFRGLNLMAGVPVSGYLFRGTPWQTGYVTGRIEYAYYF